MKPTTAEILNYLSHKPIGTGTEAVTYDADKYVLRIPKSVKNNAQFKKNLSNGLYKYQKLPNTHKYKNFGQALYNLIDKQTHKVMLSICKKAHGFSTNDLVEMPLTKKQIQKTQQTAISKMRIIASAPHSSFKKLVNDLNYLAHTDFTIDPSEGNLLIDPKSKQFYIIDLRPVKKIRTIGDLILLLLTDIPDMPDNPEYYDLELQIITKLITAAKSCGLVHPEQLVIKPRALEVLKSENAKAAYKNNYHNIKLNIHKR